MTVTIGSPPFPHFPYQKCNVPPGASFTVRYQFGLCLLLRGAFPPCQHAWGVETVNIFSSWGTFRRHLLQSHAPERCIKRVAVLTESIVKMHEYPAAYGGFSDIWSCQLLHMQHPPERVRSLSVMNSSGPILTTDVLQVAVKALRPMIANKKEYQVKKKVICVRNQVQSQGAYLYTPSRRSIRNSTFGVGSRIRIFCLCMELRMDSDHFWRSSAHGQRMAHCPNI